MERPGAVPDPHDLIFIRPGADDKIGVFERFTTDDETVIARGLERIGQPFEDTLAVMMNPRSLAVHEWAKQNDYESIRFECHNQHRPMLHLAIALGYDIVGIRWDPDRGDNLVIFEKVLNN